MFTSSIKRKTRKFHVIVTTRAKFLLCQSKTSAYLPFSLPSPSSLLKLSISSNLSYENLLGPVRRFCVLIATHKRLAVGIEHVELIVAACFRFIIILGEHVSDCYIVALVTITDVIRFRRDVQYVYLNTLEVVASVLRNKTNFYF